MTVQSIIARHGHDVAIHRRTTSVDAGGGANPVFSESFRLRAFVQPTSGNADNLSGRDTAEQFATMYFLPDVDIRTTDLIEWRGRSYRIESVRRPGELGAGFRLGHTVVEVAWREPETQRVVPANMR